MDYFLPDSMPVIHIATIMRLHCKIWHKIYFLKNISVSKSNFAGLGRKKKEFNCYYNFLLKT